jgi:anti-sigma28 factor (negative regulator of flagellin synthesis)
MQIGSITSSTSFSLERTTSSPVQNDSSDQVMINNSADSFSSLVKEAGQMPEVRSELVDAYKARVASGHYPSEDIVAGLLRLIGGGIAKAAQPTSSTQSAQKN